MLLAARQGLALPIVYNTNAYDSVEVLRLLDGIVDVYLPDFKYADSPRAGSTRRCPTTPSALARGASSRCTGRRARARLRRGRAARRAVFSSGCSSCRNNVAGRRRLARLDRRDAVAARRDLAHGPVLPDPPRGVEREVRGALPLDHGRGVGGGARRPRGQRPRRTASSRSSRPPTATTGRTSRIGTRRFGTFGTSRPGRTSLPFADARR